MCVHIFFSTEKNNEFHAYTESKKNHEKELSVHILCTELIILINAYINIAVYKI